jgi:prepilin-type N-terminal cleavage/methylation domain-containing protein
VAGFSLLELMLALAIFGMVITAIYSTWSAVLRTTRVGHDVTAAAQRSRIATRTIEDALLSSVMFQANGPLYSFEADTSGDYALLSFVSRLPRSFPGSGYFGDLVVRRVEFVVEGARDGTNDLVLRQLPILQENRDEEDLHRIVLARDVTRFTVEFLGQPGTAAASRTGEWLTEWPFTNAMPWLVRFQLAFGRSVDRDGRPHQLAVRTVHLPSITVPAASSAGAAPPPQQPPGAVPGAPPGVLPPGQVPPGQVPPGAAPLGLGASG